jgi:hypothetical protein
MKYRGMALVGVLALFIASLIAGCGGGGGGSSTTDSGVQLFLVDAPLDAKEVNVTISKVDVSQDGSNWSTVRDFGASPVTINLLDYRYDGNTSTPDRYLLADTPLTEGHYTQIRLILSKVELVDNSDQVYDCEMSSQDKTGLKLVGEFDVESGAKTAVLIDFDAAQSVVAMGNGKYRLKPTARVVPLQISGKVHGTLALKDGAGVDVDIATLAVKPEVSVYQGITLVASTLVDDAGVFGFDGLIAGDYTIKVTAPGYTVPEATVTVTATGDTDAGTITGTPEVVVPSP